jgi:hypothetical protein
MTALIVLACVSAYLVIGFRFAAPRWVVREMHSNVRRFPSQARDPDRVARWRREAAGEGIVVALSWPFFAAGALLARGIARSAPLTDHELRQQSDAKDRRIAEQQAYIARLERENGVGQ